MASATPTDDDLPSDWQMCLSKTRNRTYFYNEKDGRSVWTLDEVYAFEKYSNKKPVENNPRKPDDELPNRKSLRSTRNPRPKSPIIPQTASLTPNQQRDNIRQKLVNTNKGISKATKNKEKFKLNDKLETKAIEKLKNESKNVETGEAKRIRANILKKQGKVPAKNPKHPDVEVEPKQSKISRETSKSLQTNDASNVMEIVEIVNDDVTTTDNEVMDIEIIQNVCFLIF
jgi:hypothetical protein